MKRYRSNVDLPIKSSAKVLTTVMTMVHDRFFVLGIAICSLLVIISCNKPKELLDQEVYEGPLIAMDSVYTKMSDSAKVILILKAPKQYNFEGGDREWPESLYLEYLDDKGETISTFRADYVYYTAEENVYRAEGNVVVQNIRDGDELNTEELYWNPAEEEFYTERFVTIQSGDEVHTGEGLKADQDFSTYRILKPQGTLYLDEQ